MAANSPKLTNADDLLELFNDAERLKAYKYSQPIVSDSGINNEKFHMDLPYEEIKAIVEAEGEKLFSKIPEEVRKDLGWEHVGSTSIKGMPGAMMPDALLLNKEFPPKRSVIQALLDSGYYFSQVASHLSDKDLWFFLVYTEGLLKDHKLTVHCTTEDTASAKILLATRDMCRTEQWAFDDYKNAKVEAATGTWSQYKAGKGKNSKLLTMLQEKYNPGK